MNTFYDRQGFPTAFALEDGSIYLYSGEAVAYLDRDQVFTYAGRWLGWTERGWIYDRGGCPMFFTDVAQGGLSRPAKQSLPTPPVLPSQAPAKSVKETTPVRPVRSIRDTTPSTPGIQSVWSAISGVEYFQQ